MGRRESTDFLNGDGVVIGKARRSNVRHPNPDRLGGFNWACQTNGALSRRERRKLFAAVARGQWENAIGRARLALGRLPQGAENVDLDAFTIPDSALARDVELSLIHI